MNVMHAAIHYFALQIKNQANLLYLKYRFNCLLTELSICHVQDYIAVDYLFFLTNQVSTSARVLDLVGISTH